MGKQVTIALFILLLLSACQTTPSVPTPIGTVTRPDLVSLINWERSPLAVVFRAEQPINDTTSFERRSDVADCTIYGDNRVVYTAISGIGTAINFQRVSDEAIRLFVEDLLLVYHIYEQRGGADDLPVEQRPNFLQTVTLVVNGEAHRADALGGWPDGFYQAVTERCRAVADSPAELVPASAYVSVQAVDYDSSRPTANWSADSGIDLAALSEERTWMSGGPMQALWLKQREAGIDVQFQQGEQIYRVAVEPPGVTRYAPPP